jgi:mgtE-like transporter
MRIWKHKFLDKDIREIFSAEFLAITVGVIGGLLLAKFANKLELVPAILILLPGFLELGNNILGSLSGRLSVDLHLKTLKPVFKSSKILNQNVAASVLLSIVTCFILGVVAYLVNLIIFNSNTPSIILISLLACVISIIIGIPLTLIALLWFFKRGYEPDDVMGPYISSLGDIFGIISILIAIMVII